MKEIKLFIIGAIGYGLIEVLWRGKTHWSMLIAGGICLMALYRINMIISPMTLFEKCFIGACVITVIELVMGCLFNIILKMNVWDYSDLNFNYMGQICLRYSLLWFLLCIPVYSLCEFLEKYIL